MPGPGPDSSRGEPYGGYAPPAGPPPGGEYYVEERKEEKHSNTGKYIAAGAIGVAAGAVGGALLEHEFRKFLLPTSFHMSYCTTCRDDPVSDKPRTNRQIV